jgi:hypothetical protein
MTEIISGTGSASNPSDPAGYALTTLTADFLLLDFEPGADPSSKTITLAIQGATTGILRGLGIMFFDANGNSVATTGTTITNN